MKTRCYVNYDNLWIAKVPRLKVWNVLAKTITVNHFWSNKLEMLFTSSLVSWLVECLSLKMNCLLYNKLFRSKDECNHSYITLYSSIAVRKNREECCRFFVSSKNLFSPMWFWKICSSEVLFFDLDSLQIVPISGIKD